MSDDPQVGHDGCPGQAAQAAALGTALQKRPGAAVQRAGRQRLGEQLGGQRPARLAGGGLQLAQIPQNRVGYFQGGTHDAVMPQNDASDVIFLRVPRPERDNRRALQMPGGAGGRRSVALNLVA